MRAPDRASKLRHSKPFCRLHPPAKPLLLRLAARHRQYVLKRVLSIWYSIQILVESNILTCHHRRAKRHLAVASLRRGSLIAAVAVMAVPGQTCKVEASREKGLCPGRVKARLCCVFLKLRAECDLQTKMVARNRLQAIRAQHLLFANLRSIVSGQGPSRAF